MENSKENRENEKNKSITKIQYININSTHIHTNNDIIKINYK